MDISNFFVAKRRRLSTNSEHERPVDIDNVPGLTTNVINVESR